LKSSTTDSNPGIVLVSSEREHHILLVIHYRVAGIGSGDSIQVPPTI